MSDADGKSIVWGQVENVNLRAHAREDDVTFAEALRTSQRAQRLRRSTSAVRREER